jgi:hypothetical protein
MGVINMKKLYSKRKIVIILVTLCFISSIVGANTIQKELKNSNIEYKETLSYIDVKEDEFLKNPIYLSDNQPPEKPTIKGPNRGKAGVEYTFTFLSTDPEDNDIVYCYEWGDSTGGACIGPIPSGEEVNVSHIWENNGTFIIKVNASDPQGAYSESATLKIRIPRIRTLIYNHNLLGWLLERFPIIEKLLSNSYFIYGLFK